MHAEAHAGFGDMLRRSGLDPAGSWRVLDIGGQDVNGTVHDWLPNATITTLDIENADIIADATSWWPDRLFDVVIATEVFEHVEKWQRILVTARQALDPQGPGIFITTCASTDRQPHGVTGAPSPAPGEWYRNVDPAELSEALLGVFPVVETAYLYPPGDVYAWAAAKAPLDITVVIPSIPGREGMLKRAHASIDRGGYRPWETIVVADLDGDGAAVTRQRGLDQVATEFVAFLDDDDEFLPGHLLTLARAQIETGADLVWPWFEVRGGSDPFPMHEGKQWDPENPHQIPITVLARTEAIREVGGFRRIDVGPTDPLGNRAGEDWDLWLRMSAAGFKFHHVNQRTWVWHHHSGNSSGLPSRGRKRR